MGIAACQSEDEFFSGQQLFDALKNVVFKGVSGMSPFWKLERGGTMD
jgi:hypothetical protein